MNPGWGQPSWQSGEGLLVLHAIRLAGFADVAAIAERSELPAHVVEGSISVLERQHLIEGLNFADAGGWILTEAGKTRDAELLEEEVRESGAQPVLHATAEGFESLNPRLVQVVTDWQLQSSTQRAPSRAATVEELRDLSLDLSDLMTELVGHLGRFSRYPRQFSDALRHTEAGDDQWIAGVGKLSCHIVWAELHEDLLSSLGHDRSADPRQKGP